MRGNCSKPKRDIRHSVCLIPLFLAVAPLGVCATEPFSETAESILNEVVVREGAAIQGDKISFQWIADGPRYWYSLGPANDIEMFIGNAENGQEKQLFDSDRLREALQKIVKGDLPGEGLPFQSVSFVEGNSATLFDIGDESFVVEVGSHAVRKISSSEKEELLLSTPRVTVDAFPSIDGNFYEIPSPDGKWLLKTRNNNLVLRSALGQSEQQLTEDGVQWYGWGDRTMTSLGAIASWSPDAQHLVALKRDGRGTYKLPVVYWLESEERVEHVLYPRTGEVLIKSEPYLFDIKTKQRTAIDIGLIEDHYVVLAGWIPDGSGFVFTKVNRRYNKIEVLLTDLDTAATRTIHTHQVDTYVHDAFVGGPALVHPMGRENGFLWLDERSGWRHIFVYDYDGRELRQLTSGEWPVHSVLKVDEGGGWVYFRAPGTVDRPYDLALFRVALDGHGEPEQLTPADGLHTVDFAPDAEYFLDKYSSPSQAGIVDIRKTDGTLVRRITASNIDKLIADGFTPPEELTVRTRDGDDDIQVLMMKPYDFDPTRKYPIVEAVYGGMQIEFMPHHFYAQESFGGTGYSIYARALVNKGFIVVFINSPGTDGMGRAYRDVMHGKWPEGLIEEHAHAIRQIARERPYIDLERVGIFGASWGGYMTQRALFLVPDLYKVGVSLAPVSGHEELLAYPEPFLGGPPIANPEGYRKGRLFDHVENLEGKLLLIHGALDINAPFSQTMKLIDALIRKRKAYDLIVIPDANHSFCCGSEKSVYVTTAFVRYFMTHLN